MKLNRLILLAVLGILMLILASNGVMAEHCEYVGTLTQGSVELSDGYCYCKVFRYGYAKNDLEFYHSIIRYKDRACSLLGIGGLKGAGSKLYCEDQLGKCKVTNMPSDEDSRGKRKACLTDISSESVGTCSETTCSENTVLPCKCGTAIADTNFPSCCAADSRVFVDKTTCEEQSPSCLVTPPSANCEYVGSDPVDISHGDYTVHVYRFGLNDLKICKILYKGGKDHSSICRLCTGMGGCTVGAGTHFYNCWDGKFKIIFDPMETDPGDPNKKKVCFDVVTEPPSTPGPAPKIVSCTCDCTTAGQTITITAHGTSLEECKKACAGICGGYTDCPTDEFPECPACCADYCAQFADNDMKNSCINACESICGLNNTIYGITEIIYYIAGIIAAIMFVIYGYKLITSTTPEERDDAKRGIMYVILALILIAIAGSLVNLLIGNIAHP